jgi:A/G-specific adenine glycosylase
MVRPQRTQAWHGTDRQCRGVILQALRESKHPVANAQLRNLWPDGEQFKRCLLGLRAENFVVRTQSGWTLK